MARDLWIRKVRVVVVSAVKPSDAFVAADQTVQGLPVLRGCEFFAHIPLSQAELTLSAIIAKLNVQSRVPVCIREEPGLLGKNLQTWEWSGRPGEYNLYAVDRLRHGMVCAEGRVVLKAIESLAKDAREAGKDLVLAVSYPWPAAVAVMIARQKLGEKKPSIVDWTASAAVFFTFEDDELVEVAVYKPRDGRFVLFKMFRDPIDPDAEDQSCEAG